MLLKQVRIIPKLSTVSIMGWKLPYCWICKLNFKSCFCVNQTQKLECISNFYLMDPFAMDKTLQTPAEVVKGKSLKRATKLQSVFKSTCNVSHTFFFGFRTSSGSPSNPGNLSLSPMGASLGGSTNSTWIMKEGVHFFIKFRHTSIKSPSKSWSTQFFGHSPSCAHCQKPQVPLHEIWYPS